MNLPDQRFHIRPRVDSESAQLKTRSDTAISYQWCGQLLIAN